jgi:hypothetical protein
MPDDDPTTPGEDPPRPEDDLPPTGEHDIFADDDEDDAAVEDEGAPHENEPAVPDAHDGGADEQEEEDEPVAEEPPLSAAQLWTNPQGRGLGKDEDADAAPSPRAGDEAGSPGDEGISAHDHDHDHDHDDQDDGHDDDDDLDDDLDLDLDDLGPGDEDDTYEGVAAPTADFLNAGYEHTPEEIHERRVAAHRRHRRNGLIRLFGLLVIVALVVLFAVDRLGSSTKPKPKHVSNSPLAAAGTGPSHVAKNSQSSALPGNLLIADRGNRRLLDISPLGQTVWRYSQAASALSPGLFPDFAFFTKSGHQIAITEDGYSVISALAVDAGQIVFSYGHFGHPGSGANHLFDPSAALRVDNGQILAADLGNCRLVVITPQDHHVTRQLGTTGRCAHDPPTTFDDPSSAFPTTAGGIVVNEQGDGYADLLSAAGALIKSVPVPGFHHPSATADVSANVLISVEHTHPGAVETFSTTGKLLWRYDPASGNGELNDPALALELPDGDVLVSDERDDRVIVIDPHTNAIVWQYGHDHHAGARAGYLDLPVGIDLVHPFSLLDTIRLAQPPG